MKHLVVIQSRFDSRRLPGKSLYPFYGTTVLGFLLQRLTSQLPSNFEVVLATTELPSDDITSHWGHVLQTRVIRGAINNVMERFMLCLQACPEATTVTRVTADNPFTCPKVIVTSVQKLVKNAYDYIYPSALPIGVSADTFSISTLRGLAQSVTNPEYREHINGYVLANPEQFQLSTEVWNCNPQFSNLPMTIDTLEHWKRLSHFKLPSLAPWSVSYEVPAAQLAS